MYEIKQARKEREQRYLKQKQEQEKPKEPEKDIEETENFSEQFLQYTPEQEEHFRQFTQDYRDPNANVQTNADDASSADEHENDEDDEKAEILSNNDYYETPQGPDEMKTEMKSEPEIENEEEMFVERNIWNVRDYEKIKKDFENKIKYVSPDKILKLYEVTLQELDIMRDKDFESSLFEGQLRERYSYLKYLKADYGELTPAVMLQHKLHFSNMPWEKKQIYTLVELQKIPERLHGRAGRQIKREAENGLTERYVGMIQRLMTLNMHPKEKEIALLRFQERLSPRDKVEEHYMRQIQRLQIMRMDRHKKEEMEMQLRDQMQSALVKTVKYPEEPLRFIKEELRRIRNSWEYQEIEWIPMSKQELAQELNRINW